MRTGQPVCKCGHGEWQHYPFAPRVCGGQADKRHVTVGGPLSPCDCEGFASPDETATREASHLAIADAEDGPVLGYCPHGVDLDRDFCPQGCRV